MTNDIVVVATRLLTAFPLSGGRIRKRTEPSCRVRRADHLLDNRFKTRFKPRHVPGTRPFDQVPCTGSVVRDRGERLAQLPQQREEIRRGTLIVARRQAGQRRSFQSCARAIRPLPCLTGGGRGADGVGAPVAAARYPPAETRRHSDGPRSPDSPSPLRALSYGPVVMACRRQLRQINATRFLIVHASKGWHGVL